VRVLLHRQAALRPAGSVVSATQRAFDGRREFGGVPEGRRPDRRAAQAGCLRLSGSLQFECKQDYRSGASADGLIIGDAVPPLPELRSPQPASAGIREQGCIGVVRPL
jgi:hypothetical protein